MTAAEQKLWTALRNRKLNGLKFRSQHPLGRFITDFYCAQARLVIEVDSPAHDKQADYDEARTQHFDTYGHRLVRFTNQEVFTNLPTVLTKISQTATEILSEQQTPKLISHLKRTKDVSPPRIGGPGGPFLSSI
jgi:very-short-patch-repair endonuclease